MTDAAANINTALEALRDGDRAKFRSMFWTPINLILTDSRAGSIFDLSNNMLGPLISWTPPTLHQSGRIAQYKTLCTFQRSQSALLFSVWGSSLMSLTLGAAQDLGLLPAWTEPSYADDRAITGQTALSFESRDITLRPTLYLPAITGTLTYPRMPQPLKDLKLPCVLLVPGSGPVDRDETAGGGKCFRDLAHGSAAQQIVTLRMDKPASLVMLKQVVTKNLTLEDEYVTPGLAALQWLSKQPSIDPERIFILGHSLGGCVAPRLAKAARAAGVKVAGVVCCAPCTSLLVQTIRRQMVYLQRHFPRAKTEDHEKELAQLDAVLRVVDAGGLKAGEADPTKELPTPIPLSYLMDVRRNDPIEIAKGLGTPMLFVQGKADWQVTMENEYVAWRTGMEGAKGMGEEGGIEWKVYDRVGHMLAEVDEEELKGNFQYMKPWHVKEEIVRDVAEFVWRISGGRVLKDNGGEWGVDEQGKYWINEQDRRSEADTA